MARLSTDELTRALHAVVDGFKGRISYAEAVGALEFVKSDVLDRAKREEDEEEDEEESDD